MYLPQNWQMFAAFGCPCKPILYAERVEFSVYFFGRWTRMNGFSFNTMRLA